MAFKLQKPILVSGLGLTIAVWVMEALHPISVHGFGGAALWSAIALGSGFWLFRQQKRSPLPLDLLSSPPDRAAVEKELSGVSTLIDQLVAEISPEQADASAALVQQLRQNLADVEAGLQRKQARLAIVGGRSVGKTALAQRLSPGSESSSDGSNDLDAIESDRVKAADLVLFVTAGDLTEPEFQTIDTLLNRQQRVLLVFNKQDQYLPDERALILQQLRDRMVNRLAAEDVVAIAAQPMPMKVRQHQEDGSIVEKVDQPEADLTALKTRFTDLLLNQGQQLILTTGMRQALDLRKAVRCELNQLRRDRAMPVIEQAQWIAAAAAFANPVPSLDLLATAAVNAQLVADLGAIYQQNLSVDWTKTIAARMGEVMVKLGIVEVTSQTIAPLLKTHALTYVAGGLMQGTSAAYLTRVAGLSLIAFLEEQGQTTGAISENTFSIDRLTATVKSVFQDNQRAAFLQTLVNQAIARFAPEPAAARS